MRLNVEDYRRAARRALPEFVFDYINGAADDGSCLARNRRDLDAVTLTPRILRDTRQLDLAPSAISALPAIVDVVRGRIPVFMDSGVRRGSDVVRALSLGARAVFVGRPVLYALATSGQAGVEAVLGILARELELCMTLLGVDTASAINEKPLD